MKSFSEIVEAKEEDGSKIFRLVVLADRPKQVKENASSTKLVTAAEKKADAQWKSRLV